MELTARQMNIIEAAIEIIAQMGYEKLTTKNLAAKLKLTEAALYRHFPSKHELVRMVLCYFEQLSCRVIEQIKSEDLSPVERIRKFVTDRYELFTANPDLAMVMFSEELFKSDHAYMTYMQDIMHIHRDHVVGYISEGQKAGEIDPGLKPIHVFRMVVGSMRLIVTQWNLSGHGFDLIIEGGEQLNSIIKLIEVRK